MKFTLPKNDELRVIKKFTLFPKTIGYERRWFETVYIIQEFKDQGYYGTYWRDIQFTTKAVYDAYKASGNVFKH